MKINNTIIHSAILLCSTMVPRGQNLADFTVEYLKNKKLTVDPDVVANNMENYNRGAKLYASYRDNISRIDKVSFIQELYRYIWIYKLVASEYTSLTPLQLWKILGDKYEEEKLDNEELDRTSFGAFKLIDREFCKNEYIRDNGKILSGFLSDFDNALDQFYQVFSKLEGYEYMAEIYTGKAIDKAASGEINQKSAEDIPVQTFRQKVQPGMASGREKEARHPSVSQDLSAKSSKAPSGKTELQLQDEIKILKRAKHDLEVKLSYAKKDAMRDFICTLTDYSLGCPLSELYRLLGSEETPIEIKGVINNLFVALESANIKLTRDNIGEKITLTEKNLKTYAPHQQSQLSLGDTAEVFYPGYKYGHEIMVRPVIKNTEKAGEEANENG